MKSARDDRLLSANDVINLKFKIAPRVIKRVCKGIVFFFLFFFYKFQVYARAFVRIWTLRPC